MNFLMMPATGLQAASIVALMASEDRDRMTGGFNPVHLARRSTLSWCGVHDGLPMVLGGVLGDNRCGVGWMISTPELHRQKKFLISQSATVMAAIRAHFDAVDVIVEDCYPRSVRWLLWLGFQLRGTPADISTGDRIARVNRFSWCANVQ